MDTTKEPPKRSLTWRTKQSEGLKRAYREGKMVHAKHQTPDFIIKRITPLVGRKRAKEALEKARMLKDMPNHMMAKEWTIRDPKGVVYQFSNLGSWARKNVHLFEDERPHAKTPFVRRIASGIEALFASHGKLCSYKGWVAVSKREIANDAPDLLGRDVPNNLSTIS